MIFKLGNRTFTIGENELKNKEIITSFSTGKKLKKFDSVFNVRAANKHWFEEVINNGEIFEIDDNGSVLTEFEGRIKSSMHVGPKEDENTVYTYDVSFEETEELELEYLQLGDLVLSPYNYSEEYDNGIISTAYIKVNKDEFEKLKKLSDSEENYFNVIRKGISNNTLQMRFGRNIWSEHDSYFKVKLTLVESIYDKEAKNHFHSYESSNVKNKIVKLELLVEDLMNTLLEKNAITDKELAKIKSNINSDEYNIRYNDKYREFFKVEDIDEF